MLLTLGLVLMVAPFVWMVLGSFKPQGEFLRLPPTWLPEAADDRTTTSGSSTSWTCRASSSTRSSSPSASPSATSIFAPMLGYALAKLQFFGKGVLMGLVLATLMLPGAAILVPLSSC